MRQHLGVDLFIKQHRKIQGYKATRKESMHTELYNVAVKKEFPRIWVRGPI